MKKRADIRIAASEQIPGMFHLSSRSDAGADFLVAFGPVDPDAAVSAADAGRIKELAEEGNLRVER